MALRFTVLASGSSGNASLVQAGGYGLLLDIGLGPRQLAGRLTAAGASWHHVNAVLLTHTHGDHWNERTLQHLLRRQIPIYCHAEHGETLQRTSAAFAALWTVNLVHLYDASREVVLCPGLRCLPLTLCHDCGPTFGFRFEGTPDLFGQACALAYAADLGCWNGELVQALCDVDLLALEFNHDVDLEYASGRQPRLIARVLSDEGHLSNAQAAALLREVVRRSSPGRPRQLVQLHLSRECNRPRLAVEAARAVFAELGRPGDIHTASQYETGPTFHLGLAGDGPQRRSRPRSPPARSPSVSRSSQSLLPGLEW